MDTASAYDTYAVVFDSLKGDRSETIDRVGGLIQQHHPDTKHVLELACGTGSILEGLKDSYHVTGLDASPAMLAHAKRKMPDQTFYIADMANFHLGQKFDTIYCVHNSINHLLSFADWTSLFDCVHTQLKPGGLFIFDLDTKERMERMMDNGMGVWPADENYVLTKVTKHPQRDGHYNREMRVFLQKDPYSFSCYPLTVEFSTHPVSDIQQALFRQFEILDDFTLHRVQSPADRGRMYIVCRKL